MPVNVYLDTEFTAFRDPAMRKLGFPYSPNAKLVSAGLVAQDGQEIYIEVHDPIATESVSDFVREFVLSQFNIWPGVYAKSLEDAGHATADFLKKFSEPVHIFFDYHEDCQFIWDCIKAAGRIDEIADKVAFLLIEVDESLKESYGAEWEIAVEDVSRSMGLLPHHALADARTLRQVVERCRPSFRRYMPN